MMKKIIIISFLILMICNCGSGTSAVSFQHIIDEYKEVLCVNQSSSSSISEKTKALERQLELNSEYLKSHSLSNSPIFSGKIGLIIGHTGSEGSWL